jgi:hypothetical protein
MAWCYALSNFGRGISIPGFFEPQSRYDLRLAPKDENRGGEQGAKMRKSHHKGMKIGYGSAGSKPAASCEFVVVIGG